ncbi:MAG: hypothetical protein ACLT3Y_08355, partial [Ruminococcus callidus]
AFEGFLSVNRNQRAAHLEQLRDEQRTMIFYEAPHKLCRTLADMAAVFGGDRSLSLCRELTKIHEEVQLTTFAQAIAYYENTPPRGEYVLVVAGAVPQKAESVTLEEAVEQVRRCVADGQKLTQACRPLPQKPATGKSELYDAAGIKRHRSESLGNAPAFCLIPHKECLATSRTKFSVIPQNARGHQVCSAFVSSDEKFDTHLLIFVRYLL